jgi:hypothetical protein
MGSEEIRKPNSEVNRVSLSDLPNAPRRLDTIEPLLNRTMFSALSILLK